jgi:hypothetical protein
MMRKMAKVSHKKTNTLQLNKANLSLVSIFAHFTWKTLNAQVEGRKIQ